jgi:cobalt-zinc-cadmium efflux system protein
MHRHAHSHIPPRTVLTALVITLVAAGVELAGAWRGGSLFLGADAVHLVAHLGIFGVLLIPISYRHAHGDFGPAAHERIEDLATIAVLTVVLLIAIGITVASIRDLMSMPDEPPDPAFMLLALLGLAANMATAYLFKDPAATHWSFRAALAHELSDGALTIVGLVGALVIKLFAWHWVDPSLSLVIGAWLGVWSVRLLQRRLRFGPRVWTIEDGHAEHGAAPRPADSIEG